MTDTAPPARPAAEPAAPSAAASEAPPAPQKQVIAPSPGESITTTTTGNTYTMGEKIGEGNFGIVFSCVDVWNNELAAKILKPKGTYEQVKASGEHELNR